MFTAIWVARSQGWRRVWFQKRKTFGLLRLRLDAGKKTTADAAIRAMRREAT